MKQYIWNIILGSIVMLAGFAYSLEAATFFVPSMKYPTIQEAISMAQNGDKIKISPGIYRENLIIDGKTIEIDGTNREKTILDGGNKAPCIILKNGSDCQIQNLTIRHGNAKPNGGEGGGIACYQSSPTIQNILFSNNVADRGTGGAIFCFQSSPIIKNNEFYQNRASYGEGGAIYAFRSKPALSHNTFTENQALRGEGGAVSLIESEADIKGNTLIGNRADREKDIHCYWKE
ncbi:MAG: right-handed parallel beta-helix repeat-containing protein [bacterium]